MNKQNEPAPVQDERQAFEQHYHRFDLSRDLVSGAYLDSEVRCLWDAWQARATRPAQTDLSAVTAERDRLRAELQMLRDNNRKAAISDAAMSAKED